MADELPDVEIFARQLQVFGDRADRALAERLGSVPLPLGIERYRRMAGNVLAELSAGRSVDTYQEFVGHALRAAREASRMAAKKTKNKGGRPPLPMLTPRAAVTTSVRLYPRDQQRFEWCRYELGRDTKGSEVWRRALDALERELKREKKGARAS